MAFVNSIPVMPTGSGKTASICSTTVMVAGEQRVSRRCALQLAAMGVGLSVVRAAYAQIDREELKEDIEDIKYEEEVTDVGPDAQAEIATRIKKPEVEPEFRKEEKELLAEEEEKFEKMVAEEAKELADIKAKFSKK